MDVQVDCSSIYFGLQTLKDLEEDFINLASAMNGITLDSSVVPNAALFEDAKQDVNNATNSTIHNLVTLLETTKQILEENDREIALLFRCYEEGALTEDGKWTDVPLMNQDDYGDIIYSGGTVKTSGCGLTSLCMIASYILGDLYTPDELAEIANADKSSNVGKMTTAANYLGIDWVNDPNTSREDLLNYLNEGKMVICLVKGSSHFVLCTGVNENGQIEVNDPYSPFRNSSHEDGYDWNELQFSAGSTWVFDPAQNTGSKVVNDTVSVDQKVLDQLAEQGIDLDSMNDVVPSPEEVEGTEPPENMETPENEEITEPTEPENATPETETGTQEQTGSQEQTGNQEQTNTGTEEQTGSRQQTGSQEGTSTETPTDPTTEQPANPENPTLTEETQTGEPVDEPQQPVEGVEEEIIDEIITSEITNDAMLSGPPDQTADPTPEPDHNIDTDNDGTPEVNIETGANENAQTNVDTNSGGDAEVNVDTSTDNNSSNEIDMDSQKEISNENIQKEKESTSQTDIEKTEPKPEQAKESIEKEESTQESSITNTVITGSGLNAKQDQITLEKDVVETKDASQDSYNSMISDAVVDHKDIIGENVTLPGSPIKAETSVTQDRTTTETIIEKAESNYNKHHELAGPNLIDEEVGINIENIEPNHLSTEGDIQELIMSNEEKLAIIASSEQQEKYGISTGKAWLPGAVGIASATAAGIAALGLKSKKDDDKEKQKEKTANIEDNSSKQQ